MIYLFSDEGKKKLEEFCSLRTLFAFDYDGTLAPMVSDPTKALLSKEVTDLLVTLKKSAPVAIISGRSYKDLSERMNAKMYKLIGNHGIEMNDDQSAKEFTAQSHKWVEQLKQQIKDHKDCEGVYLEEKGPSFSVHYRNAKPAAERFLEGALGSLSPSPKLIRGKYVFNVLPMNSPNKGTAIQQLLETGEVDRCLFVGDDKTDEDVFKLHDKRILSIRVGDSDDSEAEYFLRDQNEIEELIKTLIGCVT